MKKKILSAIIAISAVTALVPATSAFAADVYTVNVHYDRSDITDWDVWKWDAEDGGSAVAFSNGVATWTTSDETAQFIVRKGGNAWTDREDSAENPFDGSMGGNRSIDFSKAVNGVVDVYVAVGSTENTYKSSAPTEPATSEPTSSTPDTTTSTPTTTTSTPATSTDTSTATSTTTTEPNTETGVEGVAAILGVAAVAAGAMIVAKKRK